MEFGRFATEDGTTETCVFGRSNSWRNGKGSSVASLPFCPSILLYLNGARVPDPGGFAGRVRTREFESVELLNAMDAMQACGFASNGGEAIVLWSRGRGPYARPGGM